jgi:RNA polymerase sigma factor (sigma-70 family)
MPAASSADIELAGRVLAGDELAFAELFRAHRNEVYRVARAVTGSDDAALDVVQDVFLKVHQRLGSWRRHASLRTWLVRIAIRCAVDSRRRVRPWNPIHESDVTIDPRPSLERAVVLRRIHDLASGIPGQPGLVLRLRLFAGLSNKEIAAGLGLKEPNVRMQLSKAVRQIRERL